MPGRVHIDASESSLWLGELLDIKGAVSRPQEVDFSGVNPTIEMSQGGWARESARVTDTYQVSIAAASNAYCPTYLDLRYTNTLLQCRHPGTARVHAMRARAEFDQAGALAIGNNRYMQITLILTNSAATSFRVFCKTLLLNTNCGSYDINPLEGWDGFVPSDFLLQTQVVLQADWSGGGGVAVFPANSLLTNWLSYTIKTKGGELPR